MKVLVYYNNLSEIKSQLLHVDIRSENYYIACTNLSALAGMPVYSENDP